MPPTRWAGRRLAALLVVLSVCCTPGHGSEAAEQGSDVAQQIRELYAAHNPDKLPSVPGLLVKYKGRERELLLSIRDKYGVVSVPPPLPPPPPTPTPTPQPRDAALPPEAAAPAHPLAWPAPEQRREHDRAFHAGMALHMRGELPAAEAQYRTALRSHPSNAMSLTYLAMVLGAQPGGAARAEERERLLRLALRAEPLHDRAAFELSGLLPAASPEAEALRGTAKRQGKWGQEMRLKSYETALSGGGSDAAGKEALRYFGLGCPPYICTSGVFGLAEGWWEAILAAEQRAIAEAEGAGAGAPDA